VIYVYCERPSAGARVLAGRLQTPVISGRERVDPGDWIVCWGRGLQEEHCLNSHAGRSKLTEMEMLSAAGVPVPACSLRRVRGWHGRRERHTQGRDFISPPRRPAYWVEHLRIADEWRFHMFRRRDGRVISLRAGHKMPKDVNSNGALETEELLRRPWLRSGEDWYISYAGDGADDMRELARAGLAALDLDFGAVDLARLEDGSVRVLEVNTRPGLDEGGETVDRYVREIRRRCRA